jgi:hypothetical protein
MDSLYVPYDILIINLRLLDSLTSHNMQRDLLCIMSFHTNFISQASSHRLPGALTHLMTIA